MRRHQRRIRETTHKERRHERRSHQERESLWAIPKRSQWCAGSHQLYLRLFRCFPVPAGVKMTCQAQCRPAALFFAAAPPGCPWLCTMRGQSVHCSFLRCRSSLTTSLLTFVVYLLVLLIALQHVGCVMPVMSCAVGVGAAAVGGYVGCTAAPLALGRSRPLFLDRLRSLAVLGLATFFPSHPLLAVAACFHPSF